MTGTRDTASAVRVASAAGGSCGMGVTTTRTVAGSLLRPVTPSTAAKVKVV